MRPVALLVVGLWLAGCAGRDVSLPEPSWGSCFKRPSEQSLAETIACDRFTQPE
jgi:hypothetical protein